MVSALLPITIFPTICCQPLPSSMTGRCGALLKVSRHWTSGGGLLNTSENGEARFGDAFLKKLRGTLRLADRAHDAQIERLQTRLQEVGHHYRHVIATTPSDLPNAPMNRSLTQRANWLETQVINPLKRLAEALEPAQRPMFSTWPEDSKPPPVPDFDTLRFELDKLAVFVDYLRGCLRYQQSEDAGHSQEIRAMLVYDIVRALHEIVPEVPPSRGTYDAVDKRYVGSFPEAVIAIYHKITDAYDERLDRLLAQFSSGPI